MRDLFSDRGVQVFYYLARRVCGEVRTRVEVVRRCVTLACRLRGVLLVLRFQCEYQLVSQYLMDIGTVHAVCFRRRNGVRESICLGGVYLFSIGFHLRSLRRTFIRLVLCFRASGFTPLTFLWLALGLRRRVLYLVFVSNGVHVARGAMEVDACCVVARRGFIGVSFGGLFRRSRYNVSVLL